MYVIKPIEISLSVKWTSPHSIMNTHKQILKEYQMYTKALHTTLVKLARSQGPLYLHGLTLIPAWINNYIHYKVWDKNYLSIPNVNGATVEVWE